MILTAAAGRERRVRFVADLLWKGHTFLTHIHTHPHTANTPRSRRTQTDTRTEHLDKEDSDPGPLLLSLCPAS